ncbi:putative methyltransferase [Apostichopus japonicus]|uniref:Putative methyltransferase n=1 Tax=Stichopus japonicus TaxID=307972 RepID=A0A2G8K0Y7_STIJA|nr:putative methyltransferase [Apostichopus japonicus]
MRQRQAPFGTAVDVGCGTGQGTRILTSLFQKVIGLDISDAMLREAEIATNSTNVEYRNSRAEDMQFLADESVDLINVATAMHWLDAPIFLKEVNRVLRPGGCCAYIGPKSSKSYDLKLDDDVGKEDVSRRICNLFHEVRQLK